MKKRGGHWSLPSFFRGRAYSRAMDVNCYPLPNRSDLMASLRSHQQRGNASSPLVRHAASCLDEFKAETGDQLVRDLTSARDSAQLRKWGGILLGAGLAVAGMATGHAAAGLAGGGLVALTSLTLGNRRLEKLENFGRFIGTVNIEQVLDGKFDARPATPPPQPEPQATRVQAEPMPDGWKREKKAPTSDVLIDMVYDPRSGAHVPHTLYEFPRPPEPEKPRTLTIIDMEPNAQGVFEMQAVREYPA